MEKKYVRKDSKVVYVGRRVSRDGQEMRGDISYIEEIKRKIETYGEAEIHATLRTLGRLAELVNYFVDKGKITFATIERENAETQAKYLITEFVCVIKKTDVDVINGPKTKK